MIYKENNLARSRSWSRNKEKEMEPEQKKDKITAPQLGFLIQGLEFFGVSETVCRF